MRKKICNRFFCNAILYERIIFTHFILHCEIHWRTWSTEMTELNMLDGVTFVCGTIHRKCWCLYCWYSILTRSFLTQYCMVTTMAKQRSAPNPQFTPEIWGENCEYIEKDNTVLHRFHTTVLRVYRIYAVREFINTRVSIWNVNNDGLYLTITSEIIASNKKCKQTIWWNFWYFDIA